MAFSPEIVPKAFHALATLWWTCDMHTLAWQWRFLSKNDGTITKACSNTRQFFASTQSSSQADPLQNDTEGSSTDGEQIKGKEVADEDVKEKLQMHGHSRHVGCSTTHGYALKMEQCFASFVANRRRQIHLDQQAAQISEHQLFRGTKIARIIKMLFMKRLCEKGLTTNSAVLWENNLMQSLQPWKLFIEIFSMLKRPTEMENVPQKIT